MYATEEALLNKLQINQTKPTVTSMIRKTAKKIMMVVRVLVCS
jgi:hypothetical protein